MGKNNINNYIKTGVIIFLAISAVVGLAMGLSEAVFANYFKEAYEANAQQRGFIEVPREIPGVATVFLLALIPFMGNIRSAILAQILCVIGLLVLGVSRPSFAVMLLFLFIYSFGVHLYMPLSDSIGLSLSKNDEMGKALGRFNGIRMAFLMIAGVATFIGFRKNVFNFETPVMVFVLSAAAYAIVAVLLVMLSKTKESAESNKVNSRFIVRRKYLRYYILCALFGGRKQIMFVYGPWVLIELLGFKAETMSILAVVSAGVGIIFMPLLGTWVDKFGFKKVMIVEALVFMAVYVAYGFLCRWVATHEIMLMGFAMIFVYLLNILDRMTVQFAMVRSIYMRSIAIKSEDVTPSLSLGMAIDHVTAIAGSVICGSIWVAFGPEYVFILAGALSLGNMLTAMGIRGSCE